MMKSGIFHHMKCLVLMFLACCSSMVYFALTGNRLSGFGEVIRKTEVCGNLDAAIDVAPSDPRYWTCVPAVETVEKAKPPSHGNNSLAQDYKPIFYTHFHKAGGSTMVHTFLEKLTAWEPNKNGNPHSCDKDHQLNLIRFWEYDKEHFKAFEEEAKRKKANFFAMEWGFFEHLGKDDLKNYSLVVTFRKPYERFVSNLFFENRKSKNLQCWVDDPFKWISVDISYNKASSNMNKPNYYVGFLSGLAEDRSYDFKLDQSHLELAKERLSWFDTIFILERPETFRMLQKWFPGGHGELVHKKDNSEIKTTMGLTEKEFYKDNALDLELYEYAVNLSLSQLAQLD